MHILAHRGMEARANSLEALTTALTNGFSLETDLRLSKDKKIIIVHDGNLKYGFDIDIDVDELLYGDLIQKNNSFSNLIPDFEQFIKSIKSLIFDKQIVALHIKDYKNSQLVERVCKLIYEYKIEDSFFLFDVPLQSLKLIKENFSKCKIGISVGEKNYDPIIYTEEDIAEYIEYIDIIWADEWQSNLYTEEFFKYYKKLGKEVYVVSPELHRAEKHEYAENPIALWKRIATFPFNGICTDFPKEAKDFFSARQR